MPGRQSIHFVTAALLAVSFCILAGDGRTAALESATVPDQHPVDAKTAEQVYQNIQVLTGLPAQDLDGVMEFMSASMGVGCSRCHNESWSSDVKSTKQAARKMILMTRNLNEESFSGNPAITCYSCHRGQHNTEPQPPIDIAVNPAPDVTLPTNKAPGLPSTDDVIGRYIRAIGGEAVIEKLETRVSVGTETTSDHMASPRTLPIEIVQAKPNKLLIIRRNSQGVNLEGFDGSTGWAKDARGQRQMTGKELAVTRRDAELFRYLRIRETYPQMRVLAKEKIGDREAYVVGTTLPEGDRERLYFDVQSGLLVRRYVSYKTAFGAIPEVTDFDDYREVGGMKVPFTIKWSRPPFSSTRMFTEVRLNAIGDDSRLKPPR